MDDWLRMGTSEHGYIYIFFFCMWCKLVASAPGNLWIIWNTASLGTRSFFISLSPNIYFELFGPSVLWRASFQIRVMQNCLLPFNQYHFFFYQNQYHFLLKLYNRKLVTQKKKRSWSLNQHYIASGDSVIRLCTSTASQLQPLPSKQSTEMFKTWSQHEDISECLLHLCHYGSGDTVES